MQDAEQSSEEQGPESPAGVIAKQPPKPEVEHDRRGVVLPARQRVGGIITPQ